MKTVITFSLFLVVFGSAYCEERKEWVWEKGCAEKTSENLGEFSTLQVTQKGRRVQTPTFTFDGKLSCKSEEFCAFIYVTMRHPVHGAVCPFMTMQNVACGKNNVITHSQQIQLDEKDGHLMNGTYDIGLEIYSNCDNGNITKKYSLQLAKYHRDKSCFYVNYAIQLDGEGTTDYDEDQSNRFNAIPRYSSGLNISFLKGAFEKKKDLFIESVAIDTHAQPMEIEKNECSPGNDEGNQ